MDPFSLTVGVVTLVSLVAETIKLTRRFATGRQHDYEAATEMLAVLDVLSSTLQRLHELLKNDTKNVFSDTSVLVTSTDACKNKLIMLQTTLLEHWKRRRKLLSWPLNTNTHKETLQDLRTLIQWIQFSLTVDGSALLSQTSEQVVKSLENQLGMFQRLSRLELGAQLTQKTITDTYDGVVDLATATKRDKILQWVSTAKSEQKHLDIRLGRLRGTGEWFLHDPIFQRWRDQSSDEKSLWCHGIPGSGKSKLASLIIDSLRHSLNQNHALVAHVYFDYKDQELQSLEQIAASLLKQLAGACSTLPVAVTTLYHELKEQARTARREDLVQALFSVCRERDQVYLIIDALDECEPRLRKEFIGLLNELKGRAKIFVTSRDHITDISKAFESWPKVEIMAHNADLQIFVLDEINQSDWHEEIDQSFLEEIIARVIQCARGMFLLAVLHVRTILVEPSIGQMEESLERLPRSLEAAFEQTMQRIRKQPSERAQVALNCLMWITYAKRPLTIAELGDALAITRTPNGTSVNYKYRPSKKIITASCHGLITVDEKSGVVRLAHYSIHEYLRDDHVSVFPDAEKRIASLCIAYQLMDPFSSGCCTTRDEIINLLKDHPFMAYAARNWGYHVRRADGVEIMREALQLLKCKEQLACSYQMWQYTAGRREEYWRAEEARSCTALHIVAMFGFSDLAKELLPDYPIDAATDLGTTALIKAASCGFPDLVQLFLSMKADPYKHNWYGTALHCAAEDGQVETIEVLLDAGIDVNLPDYNGRSPLWCAANSGHASAQTGHTAAMCTLLDRGADVNFHDGTCTVLFEAVGFREPPEIVKVLLDYGANPNTPSVQGSTPLHMAVLSSVSSIVQMLLDYGAAVDMPGLRGRTPLHVAAISRQDRLIRLLLDRGATIDAQSSDGNTALHFATEKGEVQSITLLLANGAKLELTNDDGYTSLQIAAIYDHPEVLKMLIEAGADLNACADGTNVLGLAAKTESWDAHKLLMSHVAEDDSRSLRMVHRSRSIKNSVQHLVRRKAPV